MKTDHPPFDIKLSKLYWNFRFQEILPDAIVLPYDLNVANDRDLYNKLTQATVPDIRHGCRHN